jgi:tetratricopeptide (TPR) repeat protein
MKISSQYLQTCLYSILFCFLLLLSCRFSGDTSRAGEVGVTTSSREALAAYESGLEFVDKIRMNEAKVYFLDAIEKDPDFAMAHLNVALTADNDAEFQDHYNKLLALKDKVTEEKIKAVLEAFPNDKRSYLWMANIHGSNQAHGLAIEAVSKAIDIDPEYVNGYNLLGYQFMAKNDFPKAEENFKKYIELMPEEANPYDSYGDLLTKMGRFEDAIKSYKEATELNETFDFSQQKIGNGYVFMGKYGEARNAFHKAASIANSNASRCWQDYLIAESWLYEGNLENYLERMEIAIENAQSEGLENMVADLHNRECIAYIHMGDMASARTSLEACRNAVTNSNLLESNKMNFKEHSMANEAAIFALEGKSEEAETMLNALKSEIELSKDPQRILFYHLTEGHVAEILGDYEGALGHLENANQDHVFVNFLKAECHSNLGNDEEATESYRTVANYNQPSMHYPLIRNKAIASLDEAP